MPHPFELATLWLLLVGGFALLVYLDRSRK